MCEVVTTVEAALAVSDEMDAVDSELGGDPLKLVGAKRTSFADFFSRGGYQGSMIRFLH